MWAAGHCHPPVVSYEKAAYPTLWRAGDPPLTSPPAPIAVSPYFLHSFPPSLLSQLLCYLMDGASTLVHCVKTWFLHLAAGETLSND